MIFVCIHLANDDYINRDGDDILRTIRISAASIVDFVLFFNHARDYYDVVYVGF
jgi:hypothetical protein